MIVSVHALQARPFRDREARREEVEPGDEAEVPAVPQQEQREQQRWTPVAARQPRAIPANARVDSPRRIVR